MIELEKFVKDKSFERIKNILFNPPYSCFVKETEDYYLIHYNQIKSDFSIPLIRELRGIILRKDNNKIVCYPFDKFFNYGEPYASKIDWSSAIVEEKIDGSLIKLWYDEGKWHISTMSTIDAKSASLSTIIDNQYSNFKDLVIQAFVNNNFDYTSLDKSYTHMFELVSPFTKVVVPYSEIDIYYLNSRNMQTFQEEILDINLKRPKTFSLKNLDDVIASAKVLPFNKEGYVVRDKYWRRIKVKSPAYVEVHYIKNNGAITIKRFLKLIMEKEVDEFLTYYPEYTKYINLLKDKYRQLINKIKDNINYIDSHKFNNRKELAQYVTKQIFPAILFSYYDKKFKKEQLEEFLVSNIKINNLVNILEDKL